jgi:two-component system, sensor histidine kinase PdtaS
MIEYAHLTECGLPGIRRIPYGLHACHFYPDRAQLLEALVPYFVAGLRAEERCIWVTAQPLPAAEAKRELAAVWPELDKALAINAIRILDFDQWYAGNEGLKGADVVDLWLKEEEQALAAGYQGLRIAGNTSFLQDQDWEAFMEYEQLVDERLQGRRIIALCSYVLGERGRMDDVRRTHHCAFERPDVAWQVVGSLS